jgi:hypothetical protein
MQSGYGVELRYLRFYIVDVGGYKLRPLKSLPETSSIQEYR